jgi:hypothetical protein
MEPDRLSAALALLDSTDLVRQVRSLNWRAARSLKQGKPAMAAWHAALAELVGDELSVRGGSGASASSPLHRLHRATGCLPARDQFLLAVEYEAQLADVEAHGLRPPARLIAVIGDELRRAIAHNRTAATRATVPESRTAPTTIHP